MHNVKKVGLLLQLEVWIGGFEFAPQVLDEGKWETTKPPHPSCAEAARVVACRGCLFSVRT